MACRCPEVEELDGVEAQTYARNHLEKVHTDQVQWEIFYRCPVTAIEWLYHFPHSQLHCGGPPRLRRLDVLMPRTTWPEPIWDDVRRSLAVAGPADARDTVFAAVELAVRAAFGNGVSCSQLDEPMKALQAARPDEAAAYQAGLVAERSDQLGFDLRDQDEAAGDLSGGLAYRAAFAKARAASALHASLLDDLPRALYEARHALDDNQALHDCLVSRLEFR
jgi:hypothetical protein